MKKYFFLYILMVASCSEKPDELVTPQLNVPPIGPTDMVLTPSPGSVIADGKAFVTILLKLSPAITDRSKQVTFEVSPIGKFSNGATTYSGTVNLNGEITVFVSSEATGIATVIATANGNVQTATIEFTRNPSMPEIKVIKDSVAADGVSYAEIITIVKGTTDKTYQVTFTSDKGSFTNNSTTYSISGSLNDTVRAYLKHRRAEAINVIVSIDNVFKKDLLVHFIPAFPSNLLIGSDSTVLTGSLFSTAMIEVKLFRPKGVVSPNQIVNFYDSTTNQINRGTFFSITQSDTSGKASAEYTLLDPAFKGLLYIIGYVETDTGRVRGINKILVK